MTLRVLVIESEAEELLFLQDVLREIEQERLLPEWSQIEPLFAATCAEAQRILSTSPPHAILLDLELGLALESGQDAPDGEQSADKQCTETFGLVQAAAADVPVILLVEAGDELLATRLMRNGAEDFLLKRQIDCAPVAHSLRNAVLRRRLLAAARAASLTDSLTGLANRAGFLGIAARDRKLAERLNRRWMLLVAKPRNLEELSRAFGEQRRDLELVEAAEQLRGMITPADLAARIDDRHFAVSVFDTEVETVEEAWVRMRHAAAEVRIDVGASIFDPGRPLSLDAVMELAMADLPQKPAHVARAGVAGAA